MAEPDPYNVTDFRFRIEDHHNRDMLEYHAERAFIQRDWPLAAAYAQAAGLYAIAVKLTVLIEQLDDKVIDEQTSE